MIIRHYIGCVVVFVCALFGFAAIAHAQIETVATGWRVSDVGFGIKPSLAIAPDGRLHVTGMTEKFSDGVLWHATSDRLDGNWNSSVVAESFFYGPGDMLVAADGKAHIAIHDHNARDAMHVSVGFKSEPEVRHIVTPGERDGWDNSLAFDSRGRLFQATVNPAGPGVVDSLSLNEFDGDTWLSFVIPDSGSFTHSLGTSVAFDRNDDPHILFTRAESQTEPSDLQHAFRENGRWNIAAVTSGGIRGRFSSLAFDDMNRGHAAWLDIDDNDESHGLVFRVTLVFG